MPRTRARSFAVNWRTVRAFRGRAPKRAHRPTTERSGAVISHARGRLASQVRFFSLNELGVLWAAVAASRPCTSRSPARPPVPLSRPSPAERTGLGSGARLAVPTAEEHARRASWRRCPADVPGRHAAVPPWTAGSCRGCPGRRVNDTRASASASSYAPAANPRPHQFRRLSPRSAVPGVETWGRGRRIYTSCFGVPKRKTPPTDARSPDAMKMSPETQGQARQDWPLSPRASGIPSSSSATNLPRSVPSGKSSSVGNGGPHLEARRRVSPSLGQASAPDSLPPEEPEPITSQFVVRGRPKFHPRIGTLRPPACEPVLAAGSRPPTSKKTLREEIRGSDVLPVGPVSTRSGSLVGPPRSGSSSSCGSWCPAIGKTFARQHHLSPG